MQPVIPRKSRRGGLPTTGKEGAGDEVNLAKKGKYWNKRFQEERKIPREASTSKYDQPQSSKKGPHEKIDGRKKKSKRSGLKREKSAVVNGSLRPEERGRGTLQ